MTIGHKLMTVFVSYAQNFEDVMLWRALQDVENGFYVDVGAADPDEDTVTRAFYDRGWSGINIEPLDDYFDKLQSRRPRDTNLKVAAGRESGVRTLYAFAGTGLSTLDPKISSGHQTEGRNAQLVSVPILTLTEILSERVPPVVHFLKIDVEGAEAEVLEGLDLTRFRPWILVVEATEPNSTVTNTAGWEHLILQHQYDLAYFDGLNCYYTAHEKAELKDRLKSPPNVFDCFVRWTEASKDQKIVELEQKIAELEHSAESVRAESARRFEKIVQLEQKISELEHSAENVRAESARRFEMLQAEQTINAQRLAHATELKAALEREQERFNEVIARLKDLRAQSAHPSLDRLIGRQLKRLRGLFVRND
jgi:FkbM family methyltransferase